MNEERRKCSHIPPLVKAVILAIGEEVMVDDVPIQIGLMKAYNAWHFDKKNDRFWHDDELKFLGDRNQ